MTTAAPTTLLTTTPPHDWWEADSLQVNVGNIVGGEVHDTYTDNGVRQILNELVGAPPAGGFDYEYWFEGIPGSVLWFRVIMNGYYDGNPAHTVTAYAWNYSTSAWVSLGTLPDATSDQSYIWADLDAADYSSSGQAKVRFYHNSNGAVGHYLIIDQLNLEDRTAEYATTIAPSTAAPTTMLTTLAPTTIVTTLGPTTIAPTTFLTTLTPTTVPPGAGEYALTPIHALLKRNKAGQKIAVYAWDTVDLKPITGDALNIFARISLDGGPALAITDVNPTEINAVRMPGVYLFNLTQAETDGDLIVIYPTSITPNVALNPVFANTILSAFAWIRTA